MQLTQISNDTIVQIGPKGTFTLPKPLRSLSNLGEGSFVKATFSFGKIILEPARLISYPVRQYTDQEIDEFLQEDKKLSPKIVSALNKKFGIKLDIK